MTRLADITRLDIIGIPVFQAVRPWGRALSVHQGKGETAAAASLGALMEAIESHFAEAFAAPTVRRPFRDLPPAERAWALSDFAADRADTPRDDEPVDWVKGRRLRDGGVFWLPFDAVSLDLAREGDDRFDRCSDGLACRFSLREAELTAMLEVVERDALADFRALAPWRRTGLRIDPESLDLDWLQALDDRMNAAGVTSRLYHAPSVIAAPTIVCELTELGASDSPRGRVFGAACHVDPETALRKAVLEAVQTRVTMIAGVRDDILPDAYGSGRASGFGLALPPPPGLRLVSWAALRACFDTGPASAQDLAARLEAAGYPVVALVDLSPGDADVAVVKAFVPGLGSGARLRRPPGRPA